jgi:flagellar biosynthetic protein FliR
MEPFAAGTLEAFSLYLVRTSALVVAAPFFGSATGFSGYRIGLIAAVSFLIYAASGTPLDHSPDAIEYGCLVLREVLIGSFLAFTLHLASLAVRVAGELVGQEMGYNMASITDPNTGVSTPVVAELYEVLFVLGLLAVNGHHVLLRSLGRSFAVAPAGVMQFDRGVCWSVEVLFAQMFAAGISFAAPVLVLLMLSTLLSTLIARAVPQLNMQDLTFSLRILVGLFAMVAFAPFVAPALEGLYTRWIDGLEGALESLAR